jgi:alkane 1-monooxygenase
VGIVLGVTGINVAHELGHRTKKYEQTMAKILLLPNLYMHFFIEHNWGHHLNVSTDEDPASSRLNETIYAFFVRSVSNSYLSAWEIENKRLMRTGKKVISLHNEMIWYQIIQIAYLFIVGWYFTWSVIPFAIIVATIGFLLLEAVNYIEHYGLRRRKLASGKYEIVQPWHSWNSNHVLGRIMLYELTRHSDHHYKATRKYQVLRHFDKSPQLPYGYPGSIVLAFMPKIWFRMMNPRVQKFQENMPALNEG